MNPSKTPLKMNPHWLAEAQHLAEVLQSGGTILYPTDTIWGIGCDIASPPAVERIYALKSRDFDKKLSLLVSDLDMLREYTHALPERLHEVLAEYDRPVTVIYAVPRGIPSYLLAPDGSIAMRIVQDDFCAHAIRLLGRPITSTSANVSGEPSPAHFGEVSAAIRTGVDYTVQYRQDDDTPHQPSVIVRLSANGAVEILRN